MTTMTSICVGDVIKYRSSFGDGPVCKAGVDVIEVTETPRCKYGETVDKVSVQVVRDNRAVFSLDDGSWCYAYQVVLPRHA